MDSIYRGAERVIVWLGDAANRSDELLRWAASATLAAHTVVLPQAVQAAMERLSQREYWSRAWIVQECVLAREIKVYIGAESLDWDVLARCSNLASLKYSHTLKNEGLEDLVADRHDLKVTPSFENPFYFWTTLVKARSDLHASYREIEQNEASSSTPMPFLELLVRFARHECSVALDKSFALLPLASLVCRNARHNKSRDCRWRCCQAIEPDYNMDFEEAAIRLAVAQGKDNAVVAWDTVRTIFRKGLEQSMPSLSAPDSGAYDSSVFNEYAFVRREAKPPFLGTFSALLSCQRYTSSTEFWPPTSSAFANLTQKRRCLPTVREHLTVAIPDVLTALSSDKLRIVDSRTLAPTSSDVRRNGGTICK